MLRMAWILQPVNLGFAALNVEMTLLVALNFPTVTDRVLPDLNTALSLT